MPGSVSAQKQRDKLRREDEKAMTQTTTPASADASVTPPFGPLAQKRFRERVRRVDAREAVARLETFVRRMERRYEYSSEEMTERVHSGQQKCTREISLWLPRYRRMLRLREALAAETGTATTITDESTKAT